jgi:hypothetical protein
MGLLRPPLREGRPRSSKPTDDSQEPVYELGKDNAYHYVCSQLVNCDQADAVNSSLR